MLLDIYRDQALEKLLIVEHRKEIIGLTTTEADFLEGLTRVREVDTDFDGLPTGLNKDEVLEAIKVRGYFAAKLVVNIKEIDNLN